MWFFKHFKQNENNIEFVFFGISGTIWRIKSNCRERQLKGFGWLNRKWTGQLCNVGNCFSIIPRRRATFHSLDDETSYHPVEASHGPRLKIACEFASWRTGSRRTQRPSYIKEQERKNGVLICWQPIEADWPSKTESACSAPCVLETFMSKART